MPEVDRRHRAAKYEIITLSDSAFQQEFFAARADPPLTALNYNSDG